MACLEHQGGAFEHGAEMGCIDQEDVHGSAEQARGLENMRIKSPAQ